MDQLITMNHMLTANACDILNPGVYRDQNSKY